MIRTSENKVYKEVNIVIIIFNNNNDKGGIFLNVIQDFLFIFDNEADFIV